MARCPAGIRVPDLPVPNMAVDATNNLVDVIRQLQLLLPDQAAELPLLAGKFPEAKALARELLQRGWLTAYQVNQLFQGKGSALVQGGYILLDRLGEGGMGQVFRARQIKMGRLVALKLIRRDRLKSEQVAKRFLREIQVAAQLNHANIVAALDADQDGDTIYFAMEYVDGTDLGKWVKSRGVLPPLQACDFICQAALGLQHAFEGNMIHRDIKPANLLVTRQGQVKILDLGLARIEQDDDESSALTQENSVMGTPDYIAPEQARDAHKVDIRADLYSLGCTLFFLLTGRVPFPGGTLTQKLLRHQLEAPPPLSSLRADLPPAVSAVAVKLMQKKPEDRFQTPAELVQALASIMTSPAATLPQATLAPPPQPAPFADLTAQETFPSSETPPATARPKLPEFPWWKPFHEKLDAGLRTLWWKTDAVLAPLCDKVSFPRRKTWLIPPAGALLFVLILFAFRGGKSAEPPQAILPTGPEVKLPETGHVSALEGLQAGALPEAERYPWHPAELVALAGEQRGHHPGGLNLVALSPDGKVLATAGSEGGIRLWDPETLRPKTSLKAPRIQKFLAFSRDRKLLIAACIDKTIRSWQMDGFSARELPLILTAQGNLLALAMSEDGKVLASSGADRTICLWDVSGPEAKQIQVIGDLAGEMNRLALSRDGKILAAGDQETVYLWDLSESPPRRLPSIDLSPERVGCLTFAPTSGELYIGSGSWLRVVDVVGGKGVIAKASGQGYIGKIDISADGRRLLTAGQNLNVFTRTGDTLVHGNGAGVGGTQFHQAFFVSGTESVVAGLNDGTLRKWTVRGSKIERGAPPVGHTKEVVSLVFSPSGKFLVTAGANNEGKVLLWNMQGAAPALVKELPSGTNMQALAFSPDGKYLAGAGSQHPFIVVWDTTQKEFGEPRVLQAYNTKGHAKGVYSLAFSNKGNLLVSGGLGDLCFWDFSSGIPKEPAHVQDCHDGVGITALAFAPRGSLLATGDWNGNVRLWNPGAIPPKLIEKKDYASPGGAYRLAFTPDMQLLLASSKHSGRIRCLDPKTLQDMGDRFPGHKSNIPGMDLAVGTSLLVTAERFGRVAVWDLQSERKREWQFDTVVNHARFAADGRHLGIAAGNVVYVLRLK